MRRAPAALVLLGICCACGACSRTPTVLDEAPATSATHAGVPAAASSARVDLGVTTATATTGVAAGPSSSGGLGGLSTTGRRAPRIRQGGVTLSSNGLPVEVVERIVRQNFGRFRLCYENGLRMDPELTGNVRVRFVIEADGATGVVSDAGSDLPDAGVVACVERGFGNLSFPAPTGGAMTATYSLSFAPGSP